MQALNLKEYLLTLHSGKTGSNYIQIPKFSQKILDPLDLMVQTLWRLLHESGYFIPNF